MKQKLSFLLMIIIGVFLLSGCGAEPRIEYKPVYIPQECNATMPVEPLWSPEAGNRASVLHGALENSTKKDSYIYDLKATLHKCIK